MKFLIKLLQIITNNFNKIKKMCTLTKLKYWFSTINLLTTKMNAQYGKS